MRREFDSPIPKGKTSRKPHTSIHQKSMVHTPQNRLNPA